MYNLSAICKSANTLMRNGYTPSDAFKTAWKLAKELVSKVAGVSYGKRPAALERLSHYRSEQISVRLVREDNPYDNNAVAVIATVEGKGSYQMGYIPSEISKVIAPIIDKGAAVKAKFGKIVGGWFDGQSWGMRIALAI